MTSKPSSSSYAYARSILELADERGVTTRVAQEVSGLGQILSENADIRTMLESPAVGVEDRNGVLDRVFGPRFHPILLNTLKLLNQKGRLSMIDGIVVAFNDLLDQRLGKVEVEVTVPRQLDPRGMESVQHQISQAIGKQAVIKQVVDESIIGGIVMKIGDKLIDGSVKSQLETMKRKLLAAR